MEDLDIGPAPTVAMIDKAALRVDERYQRSLSERRSEAVVRKIVGEFTWHRFGALVCADNGDGTYMVIDGQHRLVAARQMEAISSLPCVVLDADTLKEQASAFVGINKNRVKINSVQIYHAERIAGDETAQAMHRVLERSNCSIPRNVKALDQMAPGEILAVGAVNNSVRRFGERITCRALTVLRQAYPTSGGDLRAQLINATVALCAMGDLASKTPDTPQLDIERLTRVISERTGEEWVEAGRTLKQQLGLKNAVDSVRICVVTNYNQRLRDGQRLPWDR